MPSPSHPLRAGKNHDKQKLDQTNPSFTLIYPADAKARTLQVVPRL